MVDVGHHPPVSAGHDFDEFGRHTRCARQRRGDGPHPHLLRRRRRRLAEVMAGAAGYLVKEIRGNSLVDAIRQVAAGQSLLDPAVTERQLPRCAKGSRTMSGWRR